MPAHFRSGPFTIVVPNLINDQKLISDMSELKKKYKQLSSISEEWFPRIKKLFISSRIEPYDDILGWDVIFATNDDKVYGFGDNIFAFLGD